jgi:hypothetical protein
VDESEWRRSALNWEEVPYWLKGPLSIWIRFGDERIIAESRQWIERIFATQRADGYLGPRGNLSTKDPDGTLMTDLWPIMIDASAPDVLRDHGRFPGYHAADEILPLATNDSA